MANMFNNYGQPYGMYNSMPTATQPYGYPFNSYQLNNQNTQQNQYQNNNTNMIFVSGVDDVKGRWQPPNSTYAYVDNDKPYIYKKTIDNKGQYEIEILNVSKQEKAQEQTNNESKVNLSGYVTKEDFDTLLGEFNGLKGLITKLNDGESIKAKKSTPTKEENNQ